MAWWSKRQEKGWLQRLSKSDLSAEEKVIAVTAHVEYNNIQRKRFQTWLKIIVLFFGVPIALSFSITLIEINL